METPGGAWARHGVSCIQRLKNKHRSNSEEYGCDDSRMTTYLHVRRNGQGERNGQRGDGSKQRNSFYARAQAKINIIQSMVYADQTSRHAAKLS